MILVELALQGIKGFGALKRVPLEAGLNVARLPDAARRAALLDAVYHCLFPDSARPEATRHLVEPTARESRIALTFFGRDKVTYRVIRDAETGGMKLYRFEPETKQYHLFTSAAAEVAQYLRVQQQLPDEVGFERLFTYAPEAMPSRGAQAKTRSGVGLVSSVAPSGPGLPAARFMSGSMAPPESSMMPNALEASGSLVSTNALSQMDEIEADFPKATEDRIALLRRLRNELDAVDRAHRSQEEIDQLNARKFELSERGAQISDLENQAAEIRAAMDPGGDLDNLPPNLADRLRNYEDREEKFEAEAEKIQEELYRAQEDLQDARVLPLKQDPYFVGSVSAAAFFVALAIGVQKPFIALLNIPAALVAVGAGLRFVSELERNFRLDVRVRAIEERLERLNQKHDLDTGVTKRLMEKLDVDTPSELLSRVERYQAQAGQVAAIESELARLRSDATIRHAEEELKQIDARVEQLEADVLEASGSLHGGETLRRKVERLESLLGPDAPPRMAAPPAPTPVVTPPAPAGLPAALPDLGGIAVSDFSSSLPTMNPLSDELRAPEPRLASGARLVRGTADLPPPSGEHVAAARTASVPRIVRGTGDLPPPSGEFRASEPPSPSSSGEMRAMPRSASASRIIRGTADLPPPGAPEPPAEVGSAPVDLETSSSGLPAFPSTETTSGLPSFPVPSGASQATGLPAFEGPAQSGSGLPAFGPPGASSPPAPAAVSAPPAVSPPASAPPIVPPPPAAVAPSAPGLPSSPTGPVVPPGASADTSMFDFGGGLIGGDDDDDEPKRGGGDDDGGASASGPGLHASGFGGMGGGSGGLGGGYGSGGEGAEVPDRSREMVQSTVDLLTTEVDALAESLGPRLGQYLQAFTDGAYTKSELGPRGALGLLGETEADATLYRDLEGDAADQVDVALRFALAEAILRRYRFPLLVDDPFCNLDARRRGLYLQMLGYFAKATQVIVATSESDVPGKALKLD